MGYWINWCINWIFNKKLRRLKLSDKVIHVSDESFKEVVLDSDKPVLVDFWASWCGPCLALTPVIDDLAEEMSDKIKICKLNVDENQKTAMQYGIKGIPTILIFKNGQVAEQSVGLVPKEQLKELVSKVLD
jgi:thioredoxin 1